MVEFHVERGLVARAVILSADLLAFGRRGVWKLLATEIASGQVVDGLGA